LAADLFAAHESSIWHGARAETRLLQQRTCKRACAPS